MKEPNNMVDLNGVIIVTESDRWGKPLEIAVETDDFQTYIITGKQKGKELFKHISKRLSLSCQLEGKNYYGHSIVSVFNYNLTNNQTGKIQTG